VFVVKFSVKVFAGAIETASKEKIADKINT
jgi:hypothetical protein